MPDAIVLLKNDHKTVEKLFKQYEKLGDGAHVTKRKVVDEIIEELSVHAVIEEQYFYPAVKAELPDEKDDVLEAIEEHHIVKWVLDELKDLPAEHETFSAKVTVLIENVRHHVEEEETEMFPAVRAGLSRKALQQIGADLELAKDVAPKKPHPKAPSTPPGNLIAGPGAAVVDAVAGKVKKAVRR